MSRRIQIHAVTVRPYPGANYFRTETELVIYGPAGKATLQHDCEMLLMAIADLINGGSHTARCDWVVNGGAKAASAMDLIHGWDKNFRRRWRIEDENKQVARTIIFDAGEGVWRGGVTWKVTSHATHRRAELSDEALTPAEMFRAATEIILHPPAVPCPPDEGCFMAAQNLEAPPPPSTRWHYKHEGD